MKKDLCETTQLRDWNDFVSLVEKLKIHKDRLVWFFRGQSDAAWELQPSLMRHLYNHGLDPNTALEIEQMVFINFRSAAHQHIRSSAMNFKLEKPLLASWMVMQHYRCPTRLLDWTLSPYVALYFAVSQIPNSDGAIWLFNAVELETLMISRYGPSKFNSADYFSPNPPNAIYPVWGLEQSLRSFAQQGVFTICRNLNGDHGEIIADTLKGAKSPAHIKILIQAGQKSEFLSRLQAMNITSSSLFHDIDGLGCSMGDYVKIEVWKRTHRSMV